MVGRDSVFYHVHGRTHAAGAGLDPSDQSDACRPLDLRTRVQVPAVGNRLGPVFHGGQYHALGEPVLDGRVPGAVEIALGDMGDEVTYAIRRLVPWDAHRQLGIEQGDLRVETLGHHEGFLLRLLVRDDGSAVRLRASGCKRWDGDYRKGLYRDINHLLAVQNHVPGVAHHTERPLPSLWTHPLRCLRRLR